MALSKAQRGRRTITQSSPTSGTVTTTASSGFHSQLVTSPAATSYVVTSSRAYTQVFVILERRSEHERHPARGHVPVTGTDSDSSIDTGAWTFTLTVTAVTITQSAPTSGTVTTTASSALPQPARDVSGRHDYVETVAECDTQIVVTSSGAVSTSGTLPAGPYRSAAPTLTRAATPGAWTFTLTVTAVTITQSAPTTGTVATAASRAYTNQLVTVGNGAVTYAETPSTYSGIVLVSSSGAVTTINTLSAATYTVTGTDADPNSDSGTWTFSLTVTGSWRNSCANSSCCPDGLHQFTRWDVVQFDRDGYRDQ